MPRASAVSPPTKNGTSAPSVRADLGQRRARQPERPQPVEREQHARRVGAAAAQPRAHRNALVDARSSRRAACRVASLAARAPRAPRGRRRPARPATSLRAHDRAVVARRRASSVSREIDQREQRLERVIAVGAPAGDVQEQVDLRRRRDDQRMRIGRARSATRVAIASGRRRCALRSARCRIAQRERAARARRVVGVRVDDLPAVLAQQRRAPGARRARSCAATRARGSAADPRSETRRPAAATPSARAVSASHVGRGRRRARRAARRARRRIAVRAARSSGRAASTARSRSRARVVRPREVGRDTPSLPRRADRRPSSVERRVDAAASAQRVADRRREARRSARPAAPRARATSAQRRDARPRQRASRRTVSSSTGLSGLASSCDCQTSRARCRARPSPTALRPDARRSRRRAARRARAAGSSPPRRAAEPEQRPAHAVEDERVVGRELVRALDQREAFVGARRAVDERVAERVQRLRVVGLQLDDACAAAPRRRRCWSSFSATIAAS